MAITWAQRLKRVFGIDIETFLACGGALRIIACIEDPAVIKKILTLSFLKTHPLRKSKSWASFGLLVTAPERT